MRHTLKALCITGLVLCASVLSMSQQLPGPTSTQTLAKGSTIYFNNPYPNAQQAQVEFAWPIGTGGSAVNISIIGCVGTQCESVAPTITSTAAQDKIYTLSTTIYQTFQVTGNWTGGNASIDVSFSAQNAGSSTASLPWSRIAYPDSFNISQFPTTESVILTDSGSTMQLLMVPPSYPFYSGLAISLSANNAAGDHGAGFQVFTTNQNCNGIGFSLGSAIMTDFLGTNILCAGQIGGVEVVSVPTAAAGTNTAQAATTAFVLANSGLVVNHSGTQQTSPHTVVDKCTLGTSCNVTLTGGAVFTSSTSYQCAATDQTAADAVKFAPSAGNAFALTGTGTDVIGYICTGN